MHPPPAHPTTAAEDRPADFATSDPRRWLSALADGQADAAEPACGLWRDDAAARQAWHAYHLIGDVLRSEELAREPGRDAAFLAGLRERLAAEPVVLAPGTVVARERARQPWLLPAAAAAGFVAVAGVLLVLRLGTPGAPVPAAVLAGAPGPGLTAVSNAAAPAAQSPSRSAGFIRDPQLDEYLRAHQAAGGAVAAASPGGMLRRVDVEVPGVGGPR